MGKQNRWKATEPIESQNDTSKVHQKLKEIDREIG